MWREVSSTRPPAPIVWPARLVPAPRVMTGTSKRAGDRDRGGDVVGVAREGDEQRLARVHARVARVQVARVGVGANVAAQLGAQRRGELSVGSRSPPRLLADLDGQGPPQKALTTMRWRVLP